MNVREENWIRAMDGLRKNVKGCLSSDEANHFQVTGSSVPIVGTLHGSS